MTVEQGEVHRHEPWRRLTVENGESVSDGASQGAMPIDKVISNLTTAARLLHEQELDMKALRLQSGCGTPDSLA